MKKKLITLAAGFFLLFARPSTAQEVNPISLDQKVSYEFRLGIGSFGAIQKKGNPKEMNMAKITLDNAVGMALDHVSDHDSFSGRIASLGSLTIEMLISSYLLHESIHGTTLEPFPRFHDRTHWALTYNGFIDLKTGGINNSEILCKEYLRHAHTQGLTLIDAIGLVHGKTDSLIQIFYGEFTEEDSPEKKRIYEEIKSRIRRGQESMNDHADTRIGSVIGSGDNEGYTKLLSLRYDTNKTKDLYASLISIAGSPQILQAMLLTIKYIKRGVKTEDLWGLEIGDSKIYLPSVNIYRLRNGYYGEASIYARFNDVLFSLEGGMGLNELGGDEDRFKIGVGIHNLRMDDATLSISGYGGKDMQGLRVRFGWQIDKDIELFIEGRYDKNDILRRESFPETEVSGALGLVFKK